MDFIHSLRTRVTYTPSSGKMPRATHARRYMRKSCMSDERSRSATLMKTGCMILNRCLLPHIRLGYADDVRQPARWPLLLHLHLWQRTPDGQDDREVNDIAFPVEVHPFAGASTGAWWIEVANYHYALPDSISSYIYPLPTGRFYIYAIKWKNAIRYTREEIHAKKNV